MVKKIKTWLRWPENEWSDCKLCNNYASVGGGEKMETARLVQHILEVHYGLKPLEGEDIEF